MAKQRVIRQESGETFADAKELETQEPKRGPRLGSFAAEVEKLADAAQRASDHRGHAALHSLHLSLLTAKARAIEISGHVPQDAHEMVKVLSELL